MRRFPISNAALVAGLAVLLSGCSGETPTSPAPQPGPGAGGNGPCSSVVSLSASSLNPVTAAVVRATVTKAGAAVPDGNSVQFTTDLGFFGENGLQTVSKTIVDGVADVSVFSSGGTAHVTAVFDCAKSQLNLLFSGAPAAGPFISSVSPTTGSCAGGDLVTILGGRFTGTIDVRFGGASASIVSATASQIVVRTPAHTPKDPTVPETVDLVVIAGGLQTAPVPFTFACILTPVIFSISPTTGPNDVATRVTIFGNGFQFPIQVFLSGGTCGGVVEGQVSDIALTTIVFKTPVATGANACLASVAATITVTNPSTGKTATSPTLFTYFAPPVPTPPPSPTIVTTTLPNATQGVAYTTALVATGGTPPYTWAVTSGALPGLAVSSGGLISGVPSASGLFTFAVKVTDSIGGSATAVLSINVLAPALPAVATASLPSGDIGAPYNSTLSATSGLPPYSWSVVSGALPVGLNLAATGLISGTPSGPAGSATFTVRVTDSVGGAGTASLSITINTPPAITTGALPAGTAGVPYSAAVTAAGGTPPYTFAVTAGSLPTGLAMGAAGVITGTPSIAVTSPFTVRVTDAAGGTGSSNLSITIAP
jgi:hypothetical protein